MSKCKNRIYIVLFAVLALYFAVCPTMVSASEQLDDWVSYGGEMYYASDDLQKLVEYTSNQIAAYDETIRICYICPDGTGDVPFTQVTLSSGNKYMPFWNMVCAYDDPEDLNDGMVIYYSCGYRCASRIPKSRTKFYYTFTISNRQTKDETTTANNKIRKVVDEELQVGKKSGKTDYQKVKAIHDYICGIATYDYDLKYYSEYYGLFKPNKFVCQGYSLLFDKMCEQAGVTAYIMGGTGEGSGGRWEAHSWNFVKIDKKWYFVDVTWDDVYWESGVTDPMRYYFFLSDKDTFLQKHKPKELFYGKNEPGQTLFVSPSFETLDFPNEKYRLTVSFDSQGGNKIESKKVDIEDKIGSLPTEPVKKGYTFAGWYPNPDGTGDPLAKTTKITDNVTYYAKWEQNQSVTYTVTYNTQGGNVIPAQTVKGHGNVGTLPTPSRSGYTFLGWYTAANGGNRVAGSEPITADVTYYAQWEKIAVNYTVTFDSQGGNPVSPQTVAENGNVGTLPTPSRSGYTFIGWYTAATGGSKVTGNEPIKADVTYYAQWEKIAVNYTVTFDSQGGNPVSPQTVAENGNVGTLPTPSRSGYTFLGWYTAVNGGSWVTGNEPIKADVTYYAQWEKIAVNYTVTFDSQGGNPVSPQTVAENGNVGTLPTPSRSGYTFIGWYTAATGGSKVTGNEPIKADVTYYAQWEKIAVNYTVTFDSQGGGTVSPQTVAENGNVGTLPTPSRSGYTFLGWYTAATGGSRVTGNELVTTDVTYFAQWSKNSVNYTITFDSQGGSSVSPQTVAENGNVGTLPTPSRSGFIFLGWYTAANGGSRVTGNERITANITYYAQWSMTPQYNQNTYTVIFDSQGGDPIASQIVRENSTLSYIPTAYRNGYIFMGWYTNIGGYGSQLTSTTIIINNTVYYAYWMNAAISSEIGNVISNSANSNDAVVQIGNGHEGEYIYVNTKVGLYESLQGYYPCKSGYDFKGWYLDPNYTQPVKPDTNLANGMKIYEKWEELHNWKLNKMKAVLKVGKTMTLKVVGLSNSKVKWKSLNPKIATVSANGKVKAKCELRNQHS